MSLLCHGQRWKKIIPFARNLVYHLTGVNETICPRYSIPIDRYLLYHLTERPSQWSWKGRASPPSGRRLILATHAPLLRLASPRFSAGPHSPATLCSLPNLRMNAVQPGLVDPLSVHP